ncbi:MAG: pilus assembly protein TadG-related protein [Victivallaceae bacterium]|nr:pilus assembly protein TadG-related protein [Victivallaceae bacterium]
MISRRSGTMWSVFFGRCRLLAAGEDGAVLALTLAFVMPIYILVIGIYGVGETIRAKIELQNAADAAAYSGAVVQADYLSRIATINKAMSWTYCDISRRSLDLAMSVFTETAIAKFHERQEDVIDHNSPCHPHAPGVNWNCGTNIETLSLFTGIGLGIPLTFSYFNGLETSLFSHMLDNSIIAKELRLAQALFKGKSTIPNQIKITQRGIALGKMMSKLISLKSEYPEKVRKTAQEVAIANMVECQEDFAVKVDLGDQLLCMIPETDEATFISWMDPKRKSFDPKEVFGAGTDKWMVQKSPVGFLRTYKQTSTHLVAKWDWFWTRWTHFLWFCIPPLLPFNFDDGTDTFKGTDAPGIFDGMPVGFQVVTAVPVKLTPLFFGRNGTVSVAIIRKSLNPLSSFGAQKQSTAHGILSAFNHSVAGGYRPEYICAVSCARAAYKQYNEDKKAKLESDDYTVGYVEANAHKPWNLCETDWDAVFLPVRNGWSLCAGPMFTVSTGNIMSGLMTSDGWLDKNGKKINKLDWIDELQSSRPGGMTDKGNKLDWAALRNRLCH